MARINLPLPAWIMDLLGKILSNPWINVRMPGVLYLAILRRWGTVGMNQTSVEWGRCADQELVRDRSRLPGERLQKRFPGRCFTLGIPKISLFILSTGVRRDDET